MTTEADSTGLLPTSEADSTGLLLTTEADSAGLLPTAMSTLVTSNNRSLSAIVPNHTINIVVAFVERALQVPYHSMGLEDQLPREIRAVFHESQMTDKTNREAFMQVFFSQFGQQALVNIFQNSEMVNDEVIFFAACLLTDLCAQSPRFLPALLLAGIVQLLVQFVTHKVAGIRKQVVLFLGNFALNGHAYRDQVFNNVDVVEGLLQNLWDPEDEEVLKACLYTIGKCLLIAPRPSPLLALHFVPIVLTLFNAEVEQRGRPEVLWSLMHCVLRLANCHPLLVQSMFREQKGILSRSLVLLAKKNFYGDPLLLLYTYEALVFLTSGYAAYADQIVKAGFFDEDCLLKFLAKFLDISKNHAVLSITYDFLADITTVAAFNVLLVQKAIVRKWLMRHLPGQPGQGHIKAWRVMVNILTFGTESTVTTMCSEGLMIQKLCAYLKNSKDDHALTVDMLRAVNVILLKSAMTPFGLSQLPEIVMKLRKSKSDEVRNMAVRVLNTLGSDAVEDDEFDQTSALDVAADQQRFVSCRPTHPMVAQQKLLQRPSQHNFPLGVLLEPDANVQR